MPTEVLWNDARPPRSEGENAAAVWLVTIARRVGLATVTGDNRSEWLWRYAFTQEISGRRLGGPTGYEFDLGKLVEVLGRFDTVTLEGRVDDQGREEFVEAFVRTAVEVARDQADAVIADEPD